MHDFIIDDMASLLGSLFGESFIKEEASNICVNVLSNCLEGNLEMHKYGAHQLTMETWKKHTLEDGAKIGIKQSPP